MAFNDACNSCSKPLCHLSLCCFLFVCMFFGLFICLSFSLRCLFACFYPCLFLVHSFVSFFMNEFDYNC